MAWHRLSRGSGGLATEGALGKGSRLDQPDFIAHQHTRRSGHQYEQGWWEFYFEPMSRYFSEKAIGPWVQPDTGCELGADQTHCTVYGLSLE